MIIFLEVLNCMNYHIPRWKITINIKKKTGLCIFGFYAT